MIRERLCREYLEEIERLERSIRELEDEITELRMQLNLKVDEANRLAIENASLRHKVEMMEKREKRLVEFLQKLKIPFIVIDDERFEDVELDLERDSKE
jgi:regulator of replication initiation timing